MMRRLIATSLKFRRMIVAIAAGLVVFGVAQAQNIAIDDLPEFGPTVVEVRTEALGLSATEVEQMITVPLEQDLLNGVPFVQDIHSESIPGLSSVFLTFEPGTALLDARQVVAEKVAEAAVALPGVSTPPQMLQPLSSSARVLSARLSSDTMTPIEQSVLARWVITPRLLGVEGVANVSIWGQRDRQLQVLVDPAELGAADVSLQQVIESTGNALWFSPLTFLEASTPGTAGFIDTPNQRLGIRHELPIKTADDLAQVPVEGPDGNAVVVDGEPLLLGDVAELVENHQLLIGDTVFEEGDGLMLVVEKFPGANTIEVAENVEEVLEEMAPGLGDMEIDTSLFGRAEQIRSGVDDVGLSLAIGAILLVIALALFSPSWRTAAVSTIVIAVSVLTMGAIVYVRDITANVMVVGGLVLAIAIIVDDAISDTGNIARLLQRRGGDVGAPVWRRILDASLEMRTALGYATLIAASAAIPAFFLTGQPGEFVPDVVATYLLAVAASMIVALLLTPAVAMMVLKPTDTVREPRITGAVGRRLGGSFSRRPGAAFAIGGVALVAGLVALPFLDGQPNVDLQQRDVLVRLEAAHGTSLPAMQQMTSAVVDDIAAVDGVRDVSAHIGRAVNSDQVVNVNSAQVWVHLDGTTGDADVTAAIEQALGNHPDLAAQMLSYPEQRLTDVLAGTDEDLVVRLYGTDVDALESTAEDVRAAISGIDGLVRPTVELAPEEPALEIEVDLQAAQSFGVRPGDIRREAAILLSSLTVGNLFEEQKVFDVVVWGKPEIREDVADVENLLIETPSGVRIPLSDVADVRVAPNPTVYQHEAVSNYVDVSAAIDGRDADTVVADVEDAIAGIEFPTEHHAEIRGSYATEGSDRGRLVSVAIASAVAVFLLLQAAFVSWRLAALVFATLPAALAGGAIAVAAIGGSLSIGAAVGFLAVLTIAVRHLIILVHDYQMQGGDARSFADGVWAMTAERGGTILASAIAIVAALAPLALRGNLAGTEIVRPIAAVVIGGVVTSTLVALVVLPAIIARFGHTPRRDEAADDLTIVIPETDAAEPSGAVTTAEVDR